MPQHLLSAHESILLQCWMVASCSGAVAGTRRLTFSATVARRIELSGNVGKDGTVTGDHRLIPEECHDE